MGAPNFGALGGDGRGRRRKGKGREDNARKRAKGDKQVSSSVEKRRAKTKVA